jgi:hypothetical protein
MCGGKISPNKNLLGKEPPVLMDWAVLFCREFLMSRKANNHELRSEHFAPE